MLSELSLKDFFGSNGLPCTQYFVWYWEGYLRNPESCEWRFCLDRVTICAWFRQFTTHKHASYERLGESEVHSLTLREVSTESSTLYEARIESFRFDSIRLISVIEEITSPNSETKVGSSNGYVVISDNTGLYNGDLELRYGARNFKNLARVVCFARWYYSTKFSVQ